MQDGPSPNALITQKSTTRTNEPSTLTLIIRYRAFLKELQGSTGLKEASLRDCELHRTNVRELGDALFLHPTLTSISLHGCRIGDAAASLLVALLRSHPSLTWADFSNNNISKAGVQEIIGALESNVLMTHLDVATDHAEGGLLLRFSSSSPPTQEQLSRVKALCECNTEVRTMLRETRPKAALRRRNLAIIPGQILEWFNITHLDLANNRFTSFPSNILTLSCLENLNFSNNTIITIPTEICQLTALKRLDFECNSLTTLPESLVLLPSLTTLNITKNRITAVPRFVGAMSKLSTFRALGNPFVRLLPRTIASSDEVWGVMAVLDYLRSLALKGEAKQDRLRVMIVGRENVGKTSLCVSLSNLLTGGRKTIRPNVSTKLPSSRGPVATDGVDIHTLQDTEQHVSFSVWDLAGQELYQVTHTLFLISQSVYVIAVNMTAPDDVTNIEYWLELLQARAGTPPVLFVGTHAELLNSSAVEAFRKFHTRWSLRFPFCRASYPVSCVTGYGLRDFKNACVAIAREMNWIGGLIPASFVALASHLDGLRQNMRVPTLPLARYTDIALQLGINADGLGAATKYLVNTGHALYFGELNPALRDVLFLDAQWLPKVFATIITMKQTFAHSGMLSRVAMRQVWQAPALPPDTHDQIISLFEEFEFFYRLPDSDLILVPSLLPVTAPPAEQLDQLWPPGDVSSQVSRIVELGFVPRGFIGRLLVSLLKAGWQMRLCWRVGWVIELGDTMLRGEMIDVTRSLWLHARGGRSRTEILHLLDAIEQNLTQMHHATYKYRVPCLHCIAAGRTQPNQMSVYALEDIEDVTSIGMSTIRCMVDKEEVPIALLAPDVAMSGIPRLSDTEIAPLEYVASGSFADVYRSTYKGEAVAVKQLLVDDEQETDNFGELRREALLMHQLRHANLVSLVGVMMNPPAIVMEYMHLGDLFNYLHSDEKISWSLRLFLAQDIAQGLAFLHAQNPQIVHRDVKSPNVLLTVVDKIIVAKVADIGSARPLGVLNSTFRTRAVDNPTWLAPEAMSLGRYGAPADVYALGVICWELATRSTFFGSCNFMWEIEDHIMAGHRPDIPADVPEAFSAVIKRCWAQNSEERPTASEVLTLLKGVVSTLDLEREQLSDEEKSLIDSGSKVVRAKPPAPPATGAKAATPRAVVPILRCGKTVAMLDEGAEEELLTHRERPMPTSRRVYERSTNTGDMLRELRQRLVQDKQRHSSDIVLTASQKERLQQNDSTVSLDDSVKSTRSAGNSGSHLAAHLAALHPRYRLQRTIARKALPRMLTPDTSEEILPDPPSPTAPLPPSPLASPQPASAPLAPAPQPAPASPVSAPQPAASPKVAEPKSPAAAQLLRPLPALPPTAKALVSPRAMAGRVPASASAESVSTPVRAQPQAALPIPASISTGNNNLAPAAAGTQRPRALSQGEDALAAQKVLLRSQGTRNLANELARIAMQESPHGSRPIPHTVKLKLPLTVFDDHDGKKLSSSTNSGSNRSGNGPIPQPLPSPPPVLVESDSFRATRKDISDATEAYRKDVLAKRSASP